MLFRSADFKTNRDPPTRPEDTPVLYLRQMAAYRAVLRAIYPGRAVEAALIWTRASARERAVYAAVLGSNNQRAAARRTAREVNPAELKLEERSLVAKWVR